MPKNAFQRPQPINHSHNVPRHGQAPKPPQKLASKVKAPVIPAPLPSLDTLLSNHKRH